jgi:uncharacterized protein (TIGR03437 family)
MRAHLTASAALLLLTLCSPARAQPFVFYRGIVNAASFAPPGLPNGSIARGSIFSIFGRNLGPAQSPALTAFPLQTTLGGVSVEVCQSDNCVAAIPLFVTGGQINAVMPSNAPLGPVSVRASYNGQAGNFSPATVVASSLGIFTVNSAGFGPGIVQNFLAQDNRPINSAIATATPGQVVTLWGTGLGPGLNADNERPQTGDLPVEVEIFVGGKHVTNKLYSGRTSCCAGVDQIDFEIPRDSPAGCYVPVVVRSNGVVSNSVTLAIASAGQTCAAPNDLLGQALRDGAAIGAVTVSRTLKMEFTASDQVEFELDSVHARFAKERGGPWAFHPAFSRPPVGACMLYTARSEIPNSTSFPGPEPERFLDAGSELTAVAGSSRVPVPRLNGLLGNYNMALGGRFSLLDLSTLVLEPGESFQISGSGGSDVGAFSASGVAVPSLRWTNRESLMEVSRGLPIRVEWQAENSDDGLAWIFAGNTDVVLGSMAAFTCLVPLSAGSFDVPAYITSALPASRPRPLQSVGWLAVARITGDGLRSFQASGVDRGYLAAEFRVIQAVRYH